MAMLSISLALGGCGNDDFPSLAQRPAERDARNEATAAQSASAASADAARQAGSMAPVPEAAAAMPASAPPSLPPTASLTAQLDALVAQARAAHVAFEAALPAADSRTTAAQGAAPASEAWSDGTEALAALIVTRAPTVTALSTLDRMRSDDTLAHALDPAPGDANGAPVDRPETIAIDAAQSSVAALADDEQARINALATRLAE